MPLSEKEKQFVVNLANNSDLIPNVPRWMSGGFCLLSIFMLVVSAVFLFQGKPSGLVNDGVGVSLGVFCFWFGARLFELEHERKEFIRIASQAIAEDKPPQDGAALV